MYGKARNIILSSLKNNLYKELSAQYKTYSLEFCFQAKTSKQTLTKKQTIFITLSEKSKTEYYGIGECNILPKLSIDEQTTPNKIRDILKNINILDFPHLNSLREYPALRFALETAYIDLKNKNKNKNIRYLFPSLFTKSAKGIAINGLIWMGDKKWEIEQIKKKIEEGFQCIKIKIGDKDIDKDIEKILFLESLKPKQIRLDANGAYTKDKFLYLVEKLKNKNIHSIEQPIKPGKIQDMRDICEKSAIPIALDEELIGKSTYQEKLSLIKNIVPQAIILKPSLLGGFYSCLEWIKIAKKYNVKFWITSALESNIGLNAIAQWTYKMNIPEYHGLGTGEIYKNNIPSALYMKNSHLYFQP